MPKITLSPTAATNAGIAADAGRTFVEFASQADFRWCFGATFIEADSQSATPGMPRPFEGVLAQQAFSFGAAKGIIDVTLL